MTSKMYLVVFREKEILTAIGWISAISDVYAGSAPIFRRKKDAVKFAKRNGNAQIIEISEEDKTNDNR